MPNPLPFPADEFRKDLFDSITIATQTAYRLRRYFDQMDKSTHQIDSILLSLTKISHTVDSLEWPVTNMREPFPIPQIPIKFEKIYYPDLP